MKRAWKATAGSMGTLLAGLLIWKKQHRRKIAPDEICDFCKKCLDYRAGVRLARHLMSEHEMGEDEAYDEVAKRYREYIQSKRDELKRRRSKMSFGPNLMPGVKI